MDEFIKDEQVLSGEVVTDDPVVCVAVVEEVKKTKWNVKQCPVIRRYGQCAIIKFNDKYNLKIDIGSAVVSGKIDIEYQGSLGKPDFICRYKK